MEQKLRAPQANSWPNLKEIAAKLGLPFMSLEDSQIDPALFASLPVETALNLNVVPLALNGDVLTVALSDPLDLGLEQRLVSITGLKISVVVSPKVQIKNALKRSETSHKLLNQVSSDFKPQVVREDRDGHERVIDIATIKNQSGVVLLFNSILMAALQKQASDIHIEVFSDRIDVKYRVDGLLYPATEPLDIKFHSELLSRVKIIAELDIAEKRLPQDGRFRLRIEERDVDFRVSILPTQYGENAVIRVLDSNAITRFGGNPTLEDLGLAKADILRLRRATRDPHGLVLITGPTGSGKTTTLYASLSELSGGQEKIITIEDPIEYQLDGITQIAVNDKKGLTFASGLRSILRHDPDKILVGEIRDLNTAEIAIQAALTGHLVLASVHANSAFDVVSRFTHWGLELFDFVTALNCVVAQRLLRNTCNNCAQELSIKESELMLAGLDPAASRDIRWMQGKGCSACGGTGYQGRTAIVEHLTVTPEIAELMQRRAPLNELWAAAGRGGMTDLRTTAIALAKTGTTTLEEVNRVTVAG